MQLLSINSNTTFKDLVNQVGNKYIDSILAVNGLKRTPNIGKAFQQLQDNISTGRNTTPQRKATLLNTLTGNTDIFESAALMEQNGWKILSSLNTLPNHLRIPDTMNLPNSLTVMGDGIPVSDLVYRRSREQILAYDKVDPNIFNTINAIQAVKIDNTFDTSLDSARYWFPIPFGEVTLYSELGNRSIDFPCYPEELSDSATANYTTMPDLLYQYEPWYIYQSSGPRSNTYTFMMHRDMWSGNHHDGKANELIRFCEASCYPEFNGSNVRSDRVTLYIHGDPIISGIMTSCDVKYSGPLLDDGFYAVVELSIGITEISKEALNYSVVRSKKLIG